MSEEESAPQTSTRGRTRREVIRGMFDLSAVGAATYYAPEAIVKLSNSITDTREPIDVKDAVLKESSEIRFGTGALKFLGVTHSLDTYVKYKVYFREQIQQAPFVMLEYFGQSWFEHSTPDIPDSEFEQPVPIFQSTERFFQAIARQCAQEDKDVIVVNPQSIPSQYMESLLTAGIAAGLTADEALIRIWNKFSQTKMDRRGFLKLAGGAATAGVVGSWMGIAKAARNALEGSGQWTKTESETDKANLLGWYIHDWRDICSAEGLNLAQSRYQTEIQQATVIGVQGYGHNGTIEYLENETLRKLKSATYPQYHLTGEKTLRRYSFNKQQNQWSLVDKAGY